MSPRDFVVRLEDIRDSIAKIQTYVAGMAPEQFQADSKTIDAVVRNITIIGEAARNIPEEITSRYKDVPWLDMRDIRNVVVHEYFGISTNILWETIQHDLPALADQLEQILEAEKSQDADSTAD